MICFGWIVNLQNTPLQTDDFLMESLKTWDLNRPTTPSQCCTGHPNNAKLGKRNKMEHLVRTCKKRLFGYQPFHHHRDSPHTTRADAWTYQAQTWKDFWCIGYVKRLSPCTVRTNPWVRLPATSAQLNALWGLHPWSSSHSHLVFCTQMPSPSATYAYIRPIMLLEVTQKLFAGILMRRLQPHFPPLAMQTGPIPGRQALEALFASHCMTSIATVFAAEALFLKLDIRGAFDNLSHARPPSSPTCQVPQHSQSYASTPGKSAQQWADQKLPHTIHSLMTKCWKENEVDPDYLYAAQTGVLGKIPVRLS